jgi:hypothetical protein
MVTISKYWENLQMQVTIKPKVKSLDEKPIIVWTILGVEFAID